MTRRDLIEFERHIARTYRREAAQRSKNPELAAQLIAWAEASERRTETLLHGPIFACAE